MDTEYLKKVGLYVLSAIASIGIVFYLGYHIWQSFSKEIKTVVAEKVTYEQVLEAEGVIFRTETVLEAGTGAKSSIPTVSEGEHVRKSGEVAKLYSDFSPDTVARIAQIEDQLELIKLLRDDASLSLRDTANIDSEIYAILEQMREYSHFGNAKGAVELRKALISAIGERSVLTGNYTDVEGEIAALENEKKELMSTLGSLLGTVYTPVSGFYYSETDGYENVFKASELSDITLTDLRALLSKEPETKGTAGKTVTQSRWYLVCMLEESEKNTYSKGASCKVLFKNTDITLEMDVENVLSDKGGTALILSTNMMPEDFDYLRRQEVEIVKTEYSGLRVPIGAVRMVEGETGVYILDVTTVSFRRIEIIHKTDSYYIVEMPDDSYLLPEEKTDGAESDEEELPEKNGGDTPSLRLYDSIITEGKGLYEGRTIGG
ncbi:MAG: hypothetical protein E7575_01940 [Ruminococcaceae bacterium]|nr:hypothetical protein [Oscillospiraceae bacterium]